jgi:hypothetical protein
MVRRRSRHVDLHLSGDRSSAVRAATKEMLDRYSEVL